MEDELLNQLLLGTEAGAIGPMNLTPEMADSANVIDTTKRGSVAKRQMREAILRAFSQGGVNVRRGESNPTPRRVPGPDEGVGPINPANDPIQQTISSLMDMSALGEEQSTNGEQTGKKPLVPNESPKLSTGGFTKEPKTDENGVPVNRYIPDAVLPSLMGAQHAGLTPVGIPEPEEIEGIGKALQNFSKSLATPGFQRFLSQMGIAFSGGRPNEPGTILGQANIERLDAQLEEQIVQGLLEGKSLSEIDLPETPSSEILNRAVRTAQTERGLNQKDRALNLEQQRVDISKAGQETSEALGFGRLDVLYKRLGLDERRLNLDRLKLIADSNEADKPEGVESWQYGAALDIIGQKYLDQAEEARKAALGEDFAKLSDLQKAFSNEKTGFDPQAVLNYLPQELKQKALTEAQSLAKGMARDFSNQNTPAGEINFGEDVNRSVDAVTLSDPSEVAGLSRGTLFRLNGQLYEKLDGTKARKLN